MTTESRKPTFTFADQISRVTADYGPQIERHANGDITFHWPRYDVKGRIVHAKELADAIGIETGMLSIGRKTIYLHVPAEIAASEAK